MHETRKHPYLKGPPTGGLYYVRCLRPRPYWEAPRDRVTRDSFDFIYSLGVTTYQDPAELAANWRFIADHLAPGGTAIVSFTNRAALDHAMRTAFRIAKPIFRKGVFGQSFATFAYRPAKVAEMARAVGLEIARVAFLNQTVSPFNTLLPKPSVALARTIERRAPTAMLPLLSADFVVFAQPA